jgi:hypothetical protein
MTGPEHYREAERLLAEAGHQGTEGVIWVRPENLAAAQVHATLALTAATAMQAAVDGSEPGMGSAEFGEWYTAAGVKPKRGGNA